MKRKFILFLSVIMSDMACSIPGGGTGDPGSADQSSQKNSSQAQSDKAQNVRNTLNLLDPADPNTEDQSDQIQSNQAQSDKAQNVQNTLNLLDPADPNTEDQSDQVKADQGQGIQQHQKPSNRQILKLLGPADPNTEDQSDQVKADQARGQTPNQLIHLIDAMEKFKFRFDTMLEILCMSGCRLDEIFGVFIRREKWRKYLGEGLYLYTAIENYLYSRNPRVHILHYGSNNIALFYDHNNITKDESSSFEEELDILFLEKEDLENRIEEGTKNYNNLTEEQRLMLLSEKRRLEFLLEKLIVIKKHLSNDDEITKTSQNRERGIEKMNQKFELMNNSLDDENEKTIHKEECSQWKRIAGFDLLVTTDKAHRKNLEDFFSNMRSLDFTVFQKNLQEKIELIHQKSELKKQFLLENKKAIHDNNQIQEKDTLQLTEKEEDKEKDLKEVLDPRFTPEQQIAIDKITLQIKSTETQHIDLPIHPIIVMRPLGCRRTFHHSHDYSRRIPCRTPCIQITMPFSSDSCLEEDGGAFDVQMPDGTTHDSQKTGSIISKLCSPNCDENFVKAKYKNFKRQHFPFHYSVVSPSKIDTELGKGYAEECIRLACTLRKKFVQKSGIFNQYNCFANYCIDIQPNQ